MTAPGAYPDTYRQLEDDSQLVAAEAGTIHPNHHRHHSYGVPQQGEQQVSSNLLPFRQPNSKVLAFQQQLAKPKPNLKQLALARISKGSHLTATSVNFASEGNSSTLQTVDGDLHAISSPYPQHDTAASLPLSHRQARALRTCVTTGSPRLKAPLLEESQEQQVVSRATTSANVAALSPHAAMPPAAFQMHTPRQRLSKSGPQYTATSDRSLEQRSCASAFLLNQSSSNLQSSRPDFKFASQQDIRLGSNHRDITHQTTLQNTASRHVSYESQHADSAKSQEFHSDTSRGPQQVSMQNLQTSSMPKPSLQQLLETTPYSTTVDGEAEKLVQLTQMSPIQASEPAKGISVQDVDWVENPMAGDGPSSVPMASQVKKQRDLKTKTMTSRRSSGALELYAADLLKGGITQRTPLSCYMWGRRVDPGAWIKYLFWDVWSPTAHIRLAWDLWMVLCLFYVIGVTPYIVAFNISTASLDHPIADVDLFINVCFMTDVVLNFRTAYHDKEGRLVYDRKKVAIHYLTGWFWLDAPTSLPWDNIFGDGFGLLKALRLLRIFRFMRVFRMLRMVKTMRVLRMRNLLTMLDELASHHFARMAMFVLIAFGLVHWAACIFYMIAQLYSDDTVTWFSNQQDNVLGEDSPNIARYVAALYWAVTTMTTVGYGDITPVTVGERIFAMATMVVGASVFAYFMGSMAAIVTSLNSQDIRAGRKRAMINEFIQHRKLPRRLSEKIHNFYSYVIDKQLDSEEAELIQELPNSLRMQVTWHIHKEALEKVRFFQGKHPHFITALAPFLKLEYYSPGDVIVRQGNVGHEMYFIAAGTVELRLYDESTETSSYQDHARLAEGMGGTGYTIDGGTAGRPGRRQRRNVIDKVLGRRRYLKVQLLDEDLEHMQYRAVRTLGAGDYFGEYTCLLQVPRPATVVATSYCELYSLSRGDLEHVVSEWPELAEDLVFLLRDEEDNVDMDAMAIRQELNMPLPPSHSYDTLSALEAAGYKSRAGNEMTRAARSAVAEMDETADESHGGRHDGCNLQEAASAYDLPAANASSVRPGETLQRISSSLQAHGSHRTTPSPSIHLSRVSGGAGGRSSVMEEPQVETRVTPDVAFADHDQRPTSRFSQQMPQTGQMPTWGRFQSMNNRLQGRRQHRRLHADLAVRHSSHDEGSDSTTASRAGHTRHFSWRRHLRLSGNDRQRSHRSRVIDRRPFADPIEPRYSLPEVTMRGSPEESDMAASPRSRPLSAAQIAAMNHTSNIGGGDEIAMRWRTTVDGKA